MLSSVQCISMLTIDKAQGKRYPRSVHSAANTDNLPLHNLPLLWWPPSGGKISNVALLGCEFFGIVNPTREMAEAADCWGEALVLLASVAKLPWHQDEQVGFPCNSCLRSNTDSVFISDSLYISFPFKNVNLLPSLPMHFEIYNGKDTKVLSKIY